MREFRPVWSISSYHTDRTGQKQHPKLVALLQRLGYQVREVGQQHIYAWPIKAIFALAAVAPP